jgi:hypothetical protein
MLGMMQENNCKLRLRLQIVGDQERIHNPKIAFIRSSGSQNHIYTMNPDGSGVLK